VQVDISLLDQFWDSMPFVPLKVNQRFGGTCRLPIQDRRISKARNQHEKRRKAELCLPPASMLISRFVYFRALLVFCLFACLIFRP
jgi:hypothetical protein